MGIDFSVGHLGIDAEVDFDEMVRDENLDIFLNQPLQLLNMAHTILVNIAYVVLPVHHLHQITPLTLVSVRQHPHSLQAFTLTPQTTQNTVVLVLQQQRVLTKQLGFLQSQEQRVQIVNQVGVLFDGFLVEFGKWYEVEFGVYFIDGGEINLPIDYLGNASLELPKDSIYIIRQDRQQVHLRLIQLYAHFPNQLFHSPLHLLHLFLAYHSQTQLFVVAPRASHQDFVGDVGGAFGDGDEVYQIAEFHYKFCHAFEADEALFSVFKGGEVLDMLPFSYHFEMFGCILQICVVFVLVLVHG